MKTMTPKQYAKSGGVCCPVCRSEIIEGGPLYVENGYTYQDMACTDCGAEWVDEYKLVRYIGQPVRAS
jgi:hypothetical protein